MEEDDFVEPYASIPSTEVGPTRAAAESLRPLKSTLILRRQPLRAFRRHKLRSICPTRQITTTPVRAPRASTTTKSSRSSLPHGGPQRRGLSAKASRAAWLLARLLLRAAAQAQCLVSKRVRRWRLSWVLLRLRVPHWGLSGAAFLALWPALLRARVWRAVWKTSGFCRQAG